MNVTNLKIQFKYVFDNPWIAHESPETYFQWGPFWMETNKILAKKKKRERFSMVRNITNLAYHYYYGKK